MPTQRLSANPNWSLRESKRPSSTVSNARVGSSLTAHAHNVGERSDRTTVGERSGRREKRSREKGGGEKVEIMGAERREPRRESEDT